MRKIRYIFLSTLTVSLIILTGCSVDEIKQSAQDKVNQQVDQATEEVTNQVKQSAYEAVDKKVGSMMKSVENNIDPKLGEIRKNMDDVNDVALVYYKINKKMPTQDKISSFFSKSFSQMQLQYKLSADSNATISYIGKDYTKDKVPDILVDTNNQ